MGIAGRGWWLGCGEGGMQVAAEWPRVCGCDNRQRGLAWEKRGPRTKEDSSKQETETLCTYFNFFKTKQEKALGVNERPWRGYPIQKKLSCMWSLGAGSQTSLWCKLCARGWWGY